MRTGEVIETGVQGDGRSVIADQNPQALWPERGSPTERAIVIRCPEALHFSLVCSGLEAAHQVPLLGSYRSAEARLALVP